MFGEGQHHHRTLSSTHSLCLSLWATVSILSSGIMGLTSPSISATFLQKLKRCMCLLSRAQNYVMIKGFHAIYNVEI